MLSREAPHGRRPAESAAGPLIRTVAALTFAAVALATAACGSDDEPAQGDTDLEIVLEGEGTASVTCPGDDVCDLVAELPDDPVAETPPDTACTEIYGGPDVVRLTGTLRGESVDAELTRANGCEIDRFDRFTPLLQELFPGYEPGAALAP